MGGVFKGIMQLLGLGGSSGPDMSAFEEAEKKRQQMYAETDARQKSMMAEQEVTNKRNEEFMKSEQESLKKKMQERESQANVSAMETQKKIERQKFISKHGGVRKSILTDVDEEDLVSGKKTLLGS